MDEEQDELLDVGSDAPAWMQRLRTADGRLRPGLTWAAPALVLLLLVGALTAHGARHSETTAGRPHLAAQPPRPLARHASPTAMDRVLALAAETTPLTNYVRQDDPHGTCAAVEVGSSPVRTILRAVRRAMPPLNDAMSAVVLDQNTGLCSVQIRARHAHAVVTVSIAAPSAGGPRPSFIVLETGIETRDNITTVYGEALTPAGWSILVGATGDTDLPSSQDLLRVAQAPQLRW